MDRQTEIHKSLEKALMDIGFRVPECATVAPVLAENLIAAGWKPPLPVGHKCQPPPPVGHKCQPPGDPAQLPSAAVWTCPVDGIEYVSIKRMIGRKMYGEWRQRLGPLG